MKDLNLLEDIKSLKEVFWINPKYDSFDNVKDSLEVSKEDVLDAEKRLNRFAPYIKSAFPETSTTGGIIESPLTRIPNMKKHMELDLDSKIIGEMMVKLDSDLPIAGSIKARGGIYEVLKHAETLAIKKNMLSVEDDYSIINSNKFRNFYNNYTIQVGSTGNLGLSIGIMSTKLGFKVKVHMSSDAKQWKKNLLRSKGVKVVEYASDYSKAVEAGRKLSDMNPKSYFIDDENSKDLFMGYAVAALRLQKQLEDMNVAVDEDHPLFVYLPCGVGGGPGGVAYGLKLVYSNNVHCFFAEPTHSPAMLLGLLTGLHSEICVQDFGIDNITEADGLAVGRPSSFVGKTMERLLSGTYTIDDDRLYKLLATLVDEEQIYLEPSALAGFMGPVYISEKEGIEHLKNATHICWATGGSLVPKDIMEEYYNK